MGINEYDMYEDGIQNLCLSCYPCFATIYYEVLLIYGYV